MTRVGRRGLDPERAAERLAGRLPVEAVAEPDVALRAALADAGPGDAILVTGSLFLVGAAYELIGGGQALFEAWQAPGAGATEPRP